MRRNDSYPCPMCQGRVLAHETSCPACGADLSTVALMNEVPDVCFNAALAAAKQNQWLEAARQLATALHYRPEDADAWVLLGKVFAHQERSEEATMCFSMALMYCPGHERAAAALRACGVDPASWGLSGGTGA